MNIPLTYALLAFFFVLVLWFAHHLRKDPVASPLDLVTEPLRGRLSAAKIGQLVGIIVSTWVVVTLTARGNLSYEIFFVYLVYVAGVDVFGKWLRAKQVMGPTSTKEVRSSTTTIKSAPPDLPKPPKEFE